MNTRAQLQQSTEPPVLSVSFSHTTNRFAVGLSNGVRILRTDNCLTPSKATLPGGHGISLAAPLDDNMVAIVYRRKTAETPGPNVLVFWDAHSGQELTRLDLFEPVRAVDLNASWLIVVLQHRTVVFQYQEIKVEIKNGTKFATVPNHVYALYSTSENLYAVASLKKNILALPATTPGQVQIITLETTRAASKRVIPAHKSSLRVISLSQDGSLVATASEQGTLIRVWNTQTLDPVAEVRRGVDNAIIYSLAFSPSNRWLACTSDKGTLHIFDLRPPPASTTTATTTAATSTHRRRTSNYNPTNRLSYDATSTSGFNIPLSKSPTPSTPASAQEYYGLRPPPLPSAHPTSTTHHTTPSTHTQPLLTSLRNSPFAPRLLSDPRSIASTTFSLGNDPPHWQSTTRTNSSSAVKWTVAPDGSRRKVVAPVEPLPGDPTGRPVKGKVVFLGHGGKEEGALGEEDGVGLRIVVVGGGSDARWEMFELGVGRDGEWGLGVVGFRRYLTRQFAE